MLRHASTCLSRNFPFGQCRRRFKWVESTSTGYCPRDDLQGSASRDDMQSKCPTSCDGRCLNFSHVVAISCQACKYRLSHRCALRIYRLVAPALLHSWHPAPSHADHREMHNCLIFPPLTAQSRFVLYSVPLPPQSCHRCNGRQVGMRNCRRRSRCLKSDGLRGGLRRMILTQTRGL